MRSGHISVRFLSAGVALCAAALTSTGASVSLAEQQAPEPQAGFTASVDLVLLHVAVIDPRGREVPPLSVEDFTVFDDEAKQEIELFLAPSDAPLDVAMVLDSSASMKPVEISARRAAITFLNKLGLDDCAYVLPFNNSSGPGLWGRSVDPRLRSFVGSQRSSGGTAMYDAVLDGLAELEQANANELVAIANQASGADDGSEAREEPVEEIRPSGPPAAAPDMVLPPRPLSLRREIEDVIRTLDLAAPPPVRGCGEALPPGTQTTADNARRKALLVLSDGADMDSDASFYDALGAARAASVPVFPVAMGYANDQRELTEQLDELARATGGRLITNTGASALSQSYNEVVALLRSFYLIGYNPGISSAGAAGGRPRWHDVSVTLRRPNFEPLVRPGYYR